MKNWVCFVLWLPSFSCLASPSQVEVFRKYEELYKVPPFLAYAVAHQESGRVVNRRFSPWPWTINVEGKGSYFDTREEAIRAAKSALAQGKSFGGGYMQQEWRWQKHRYQQPEDVFDPDINVRTGVQILREWYDQTGSWVEAIARYHVGFVKNREELERALTYVEKVRKYHMSLVEH